ncbi:hypothetical protein QFC19_008654 [Naganishia cerealis]|uniref:Uncharacterized protein n=1 Tax=Naganishia cerealis TaxID=610337 RepID=A0ACC2V0T0_9TREE|nr:hypothetical protein QFC19_008654 [Naganishia cerealis]
MFTNPVLSKYFSSGQVIETVRGGGVFQPAIDDAIRKLDQGEWVSLFAVWYGQQDIASSNLTRFDDVMPDTRKHLRFLPRPGKSVSITIGQPITSKILPLVEGWKQIARNSGNLGLGGKWSHSARSSNLDDDALALNNIRDAQTKVKVAAQNPERQARSTALSGDEQRIRIDICDLLYKEVQEMGIKVEQQEGKDKRPWRTAVSIDGKVHT